MKLTKPAYAMSCGAAQAKGTKIMNGMMPLEHVISEVKLKVAKLQDLLMGLYELRGPTGKTTSPLTPLPQGRRGESEKATPAARSAAAERKPAIANGLGRRVLEVCGALEERFDQNDVAKAMPREEAGPLRGALAYAEKKGLLVVVEKGRPGKPTVYRLAALGKGQLLRGGSKPKTTPEGKEAERGAMLKIKPDPAKREELERLQDELEAAIEERDGHQTAGRDGLLAVAQKKVDRLVQQIKGS